MAVLTAIGTCQRVATDGVLWATTKDAVVPVNKQIVLRLTVLLVHKLECPDGNTEP